MPRASKALRLAPREDLIAVLRVVRIRVQAESVPEARLSREVLDGHGAEECDQPGVHVGRPILDLQRGQTPVLSPSAVVEGVDAAQGGLTDRALSLHDELQSHKCLLLPVGPVVHQIADGPLADHPGLLLGRFRQAMTGLPELQPPAIDSLQQLFPVHVALDLLTGLN